MITVGLDTYVTVDEADVHIAKWHADDKFHKNSWNSLTKEDKEIHLINATSAIEQVKFKGCVKELAQPLSFPRCYESFKEINPYSHRIFDVQHTDGINRYCMIDVPVEVKCAQIEEAFELAFKEHDKLHNEIIEPSQSYYETMRSNKAQKFLEKFILKSK